MIDSDLAYKIYSPPPLNRSFNYPFLFLVDSLTIPHFSKILFLAQVLYEVKIASNKMHFSQ